MKMKSTMPTQVSLLELFGLRVASDSIFIFPWCP